MSNGPGELNPSPEEVRGDESWPSEETELSSVNYGDGLPPELLWIQEGNNQVLVTIYAYKSPEQGRLRHISMDVNQDFRDLGYIEFPIESDWSVPDREKIESYRESSSRFDTRARVSVIHRATLQNTIIKHHLLEIRFRNSDGTMKPLQLPRDKKGFLTRDAFKILGQLHPSVMDVLYLKFTDEAALLI